MNIVELIKELEKIPLRDRRKPLIILLDGGITEFVIKAVSGDSDEGFYLEIDEDE